MELIEEVPLKELGEAELERLLCVVDGGKPGVDSRDEVIYWKERSTICREDDVDGRGSVTKDKDHIEQVL